MPWPMRSIEIIFSNMTRDRSYGEIRVGSRVIKVKIFNELIPGVALKCRELMKIQLILNRSAYRS